MEELLRDEDTFAMLIGAGSVVFGSIIALSWIILHAAQKMVKTRAREASRREIAAYIAEGTMSPDDGVRLMDAGLPRWERPSQHA